MIRIHALGGLAIRNDADGQQLSGSAAQPRRMAVLALLARAGARGISREKLLALLWPDADDERGPRTLAQALYALRQDLGSDAAISGTAELRLDPEFVSSDVGEFSAAASRGNDDTAAALYAGPFLDGFHLPGLAEFSRWIETERRTLAHEYSRVLEVLARDATTRGELPAAANWWRKLAALDPLNARFAIGLMQSLASSGDRAGALRHARVYEVLLEEELDLPPDREVVLLAERLRAEANAPSADAANIAALSHASVAMSSTPVAPVEPIAAVAPIAALAPVASTPIAPVVSTPVVAIAPVAPIAVVPSRRRMPAIVGLLIVGALAGGAIVTWTMSRANRANDSTHRIVAVGRISEYATDVGGTALAAPLGDLLATNLARVAGLQVVSPVRMLELARQSATLNDTTASGAIAAARAAGATDMVDGTLYRRNGKPLRLDLRRIDLATGSIVDARSVDGADLFALVDSGTAHIANSLGAVSAPGPVAAVTTHSDAAYRLYVQALHRYYDYDLSGAEQLFGAALDADSTFAMAAYYWSLCTLNPRISVERMSRAVRLSNSATERERLIIRADAAFRFSSPELAFIADTLASKYPNDVESYVYRGAALVLAEDFAQAVPVLQRAIAIDSTAFVRAATVKRADAAGGALDASANAPVCNGCTAFGHLVYAYKALDSSVAAEREARRWTQLYPKSSVAWLSLASVLGWRKNTQEATVVLHKALAMEGRIDQAAPAAFAVQMIQAGDYAPAEAQLRSLAETGTPVARAEAYWNLAIAAREQGQLVLAVSEAAKQRWPLSDSIAPGAAASAGAALLHGAIYNEAGKFRDAAVLFDSVAHMRVHDLYPSGSARRQAWALTHVATALAGMGDTNRLAALADSIQMFGTQSAYGRDQRLHHYVRGLLSVARGNDAAAINELQLVVRSRTVGFTRANYTLALALMRQHRPKDAIAVLGPALRGDIDGSNLYISRTLIHEALATAWEASGNTDSAATHYDVIAKVWSNGDPMFKAKAAEARAWSVKHARSNR